MDIEHEFELEGGSALDGSSESRFAGYATRLGGVLNCFHVPTVNVSFDAKIDTKWSMPVMRYTHCPLISLRGFARSRLKTVTVYTLPEWREHQVLGRISS